MPRKNRSPATFLLPTGEFRALPVPEFPADEHSGAKLASCFVPCDAIPEAFGDWMEVNPRKPELDKAGQLKSSVARAMVETLKNAPERFSLLNQGIWILAESAEFAKAKGGQGNIKLVFTDRARHGVANGGHTFKAIRQVASEREDEGLEGADGPWGAFVRLHIITGVEPDELAVSELALGLNSSIQVDAASIENLARSFDPIKKVLTGQRGFEQIHFRQGDVGPVDIEDVLLQMNLFDLNVYEDWKTYPNGLFGHTKVVLDNFSGKSKKSFSIITPLVHEILVLSEQIMQAVAPYLPKVKVSDAKTAKPLGAPDKKRDAYFAVGKVPKHFPLGWLYPMLGAFRANLSRPAWKRGKFEWLVPPADLLPAVAEQFARVVYQEHKDNGHKPAEVGRKEAAYRACYSVMMMQLSGMGVKAT
jgi:hypothetical protein